MSSLLTKRRLFLGIGVLALGAVLTVALARIALTGMAVGFFLKKAGASEITFNVTRASPWRVVVEDVAFLLKTRNFAAKRVSVARDHWWSASLGSVRVEQARVPVAVEDIAKQLQAPSEPAKASSLRGPLSLPLEELSVDGQIIVQAAGLPEQALTVKLQARQIADKNWEAQVQVNGPGLGLTASGIYQTTKQQLDFSVPAVNVELKTWQIFAQRIIPLPDFAGWEVEGLLGGKGAGRYVDGHLTTTGTVQLREGRVNNTEMGITAEGVALDLEFLDFSKVTTKPGSLRVRELRTKQLPLQNLAAEFSLAGTDRINVAHLTLSALGGTVGTEPFIYFPSHGELDAVVLVNGISVEEIMALTKDLPATATGRVNGRFPLTLGANGLHLGTGWLELTPGVNAEIAFRAAGLLTAGTSPKSPSYSVLQKIESGLLKLRISELRLDIQPTGAPEGRSATLHLAGAPVDPEVKAPVILDLNVNGPLEKLLKLGLGSNLSVGAKP